LPGLPDQRERFEIMAALIWESLVPKGSAEIQTFDSKKAKTGYLTKETYKQINYSNFITLREFVT
jgi:hypothetical protein